ncbi:hypothetical protein [Oleiharenicola lentus]|uniref:hypothetical protein n=1 Tax=Oleiharenicola lentus TaxID=2508720 RepID=UPI003F6795AF
MSNKATAELLLKGKKSYVRVKNLKQATAVRVAGHRLGGVLTVSEVQGGYKLVKSKAKVTHRPVKKVVSNRELAEQVLKGKKAFIRVANLKAATAVRVAAHRLGKVLTVKKDKQGLKLVKSSSRVAHRK